MIRVLVADDHPVFRRGLVGVLTEEPEVEVVGEAGDGDAAMALAAELGPDVVLMDLHMEGTGGIAATRRLTAELPDIAVLVLTMLDDEESLHSALRAGARGYLVKGASGDRILQAVRAVAAGEAVFGADVAGLVLGRLISERRTVRPGPFPMLTDREEEILTLMSHGRTNIEIARRLVVSDKTVRNHITNIFAKLGVADRSQAIIRARDAGLG
ncbi:response regulator transcription factor [Kribbella sp. NBC_00359]|uniref:response regulator transcription factor n=1 Tax=Kribbella sp. NBC_00359 TaxID=2975966 RepID=UPI002E1BF992